MNDIIKNRGLTTVILIMHLISNVSILTIVLAIIYIGLTIVKSLCHTDQGVHCNYTVLELCNYAIRALRSPMRLSVGHSRIRLWGIPTISLHTLLTNIVLLGAIEEDVATA